MSKKMYFIVNLKDNAQCTITAGYKSAVCSNGYVELDPEADKAIIETFNAKEYAGKFTDEVLTPQVEAVIGKSKSGKKEGE